MHYPKNKALQQIFDRAGECLETGIPFVLYRKPGEGELIGIFQGDASLRMDRDFTGRGFVMAPFDLAKGTVLIQGDQVLRVGLPPLEVAPQREVVLPQGGRAEHMRLVEQGLAAIQGGGLKKVVLSHRWETARTKGPLEILHGLLQRYPMAFCYLFHHPKVGTWCGASPESLVQVQGRGLQSMALAGTLPYTGEDLPPWGPKELDEQQMVTAYIAKCLGPYMEALEVAPVESIRAGGLWHLRSHFSGTLAKGADLRSLVEALHPTPAVGGVPKEAAKAFIQAHETYDRAYYTGFLGELNLKVPGELALFVNLRCMELRGDRALVYAGGGITAGSNPLEEWIEIQNKSRTVLGSL